MLVYVRQSRVLFRNGVGPSKLVALRPAPAVLHLGPIASLARPPRHFPTYAGAPKRLWERHFSSSRSPRHDSASSEAATDLEQRVDLKALDVDGVYHFALKHTLDEEAAGALEEQKVDGKVLSRVTREKLATYGLFGRAASRLLCAVREHTRADVEKLDVDGVCHFALEHELTPQAVRVLKKEELDGKRLLKVTKEGLIHRGLTWAAAGKLLAAVREHTQVDLEKLDVDGVYRFALKHELDAEAAGVLKKQLIDGVELLTVTKEALASWGIMGGPALRLLRAVRAQEALEPVPFTYGKPVTTETFVNREREVARLFALNVRNNWVKGTGQYQMYTIPISSHLFGAGKTALGLRYTDQLRKASVETAIRQELDDCRRDYLKLDGPYASKQLEMMRDDVTEVHVQAGSTCEEALRKLSAGLGFLLGKPAPDEMRFDFACKVQLAELRQLGPVFVTIDEIGALGYYELQRLCDKIAQLYFAGDHRNPLHVYLAGKEHDADFGNKFVDGGKCPSRSRQELLLLRSLNTANIRTIAKEDFGLSLADEVCHEVATVTGGVPRMIRYIMHELRHRAATSTEAHTVKAVQEACGVVASRCVDFIYMDRNRLIDFALCIAYQELERRVTVDRGRSDEDRFLSMVRRLPILADRLEKNVYSIRCCPLYLTHYHDELAQIDLIQALTAAGGDSRPVTDRSDRRESQVLDRLQTNLIPPLLEARRPGAGSAPGTPVETSLDQWLPSLFKKDAQANRLLSVLQELGLGQDLSRPLFVYFAHVDLEKKLMQTSPWEKTEKEKKEGQKMESKEIVNDTNMWKTVEELLDNEGKRDDAATILTSTCSPDVLVRLPASHYPGLQLITFRTETSTDKKGSHDDDAAKFGAADISREAAKLPTDMPDGSRQLLVLCAHAVTKELEVAIGRGRFLVLSNMAGEGVVHWAKRADRDADGSLKTVQDEEEGECEDRESDEEEGESEDWHEYASDDGIEDDDAESEGEKDKQKQLSETLQNAADNVPAGAIVALMAPDLFKDFTSISPL